MVSNMQKSVSVIVPIYHGQNYMQGLVAQIEEAAKRVTDYAVEILFINDDPALPIEPVFQSDVLNIQIVNTDVNRGIHGARVEGLLHCRGEFVVFLDQDDRIDENFLARQLALIGGADAIVCNVLHDGHSYYDVDRPFRTAISRESMLFNQCMIISPGQVLLRKSAIPDLWKENIMHTTGADDWLLWICMLCADKTFAYNEEVLFEHKIHYGNTSIDSVRMADSENEVVRIVEQNGILKGEELEKIKNTVYQVQRRRLRDNEKCKRLFRVLSDWMTLREQGKYVEDYLHKSGVHNGAIYGYGHLGRHLSAELKACNFPINYIIDRNAKYIDTQIQIKTLDEDMEDVDAVVIAILKDNNSRTIETDILQKMNTKVLWLTDILSEMLGM